MTPATSAILLGLESLLRPLVGSEKRLTWWNFRGGTAGLRPHWQAQTLRRHTSEHIALNWSWQDDSLPLSDAKIYPNSAAARAMRSLD